MKETIEPVWMDLAYVPHHGSSEYANAEFFKRVRARYYVFSGVEPSKEVFNALLEAKKTWENKEQGKGLYNGAHNVDMGRQVVRHWGMGEQSESGGMLMLFVRINHNQ